MNVGLWHPPRHRKWLQSRSRPHVTSCPDEATTERKHTRATAPVGDADVSRTTTQSTRHGRAKTRACNETLTETGNNKQHRNPANLQFATANAQFGEWPRNCVVTDQRTNERRVAALKLVVLCDVLYVRVEVSAH